MTFVTVIIDALGDNHIVSNWARDIDVWMNKKTTVGVCEFLLDNTGDIWGDDFEPNDTISISINGTLMFTGFVDNVLPSLDKKGVLKNQLIVKGRDTGRKLIDLYYTEDFVNGRLSGSIIDDILAGVGDPMLYTDPGGTPAIKFSSQRTKLVDSFKEISDLSTYDMYIDTNGRLQFFARGTVSSGVALKSVSGAADNNLLDFIEYEEIGFDIKNLIEIHGGSMKDHWTDANALDWVDLLGGATAFSNEGTVFLNGSGSIKVVAADNDETFGLDFSTVGGNLYSQGGTVDLSRFAQNKVKFRHEDGSGGVYSFKPYLKDATGNGVVFHRNEAGQGSKGFTHNLGTTLEQWYTLSYQTGLRTGNEILSSALQASGRWNYLAAKQTITFAGAYTSAALLDDNGSGQGTITADGGTPFSTLAAGGSITLSNAEDPANDGDYIIFSATDTVITLTTVLPTTNGDDTAVLITVDFNWHNIEDIGFQLLTSGLMDTVFVDGWYMPTVEVKAVTDDPVSDGLYDTRMFSEFRKDLTSQISLQDESDRVLAFRKDPLQKFRATARGQTGTKYAAQTLTIQAPDYGLAGATTYVIQALHHILHNDTNTRGWDFITKYELALSGVDSTRVIADDNPLQATLLKLARENRGFKGAQVFDEEFYGDVITGFTPQLTTGTALPTDANEGDRFYDNALELEYEFTGGAWVILTFASSALVKGMQPFDSSMFFEVIRTSASPAVTFDIDVNDAGSGKTTITASAGTPFSDFSAGDNLVIQGCEDADNDSTLKIVDSVGGGGASITLTNMVGGADTATDETCVVSVSDAVKWTNDGANPEIFFADGDTQQINSGSGHGIPTGANWIHFTVGNAALTVTNVYGNAVGDAVAVICRLEITVDKEPIIFPFYSRGQNMSLDALAAGSVDTLVLTAEYITGKRFRSASGNTNVEFTGTGIIGQNAGITQFSLSSVDGTATAGAGAVILDINGITIRNDHTGFNTNLEFQKLDATPMGKIFSFDAVIGGGGGAFEGLTLRNASNKDIILLATNGTTGKIALDADNDIFQHAGADITLSADVDVELISGRDVVLGADDDVIIQADDNIQLLATGNISLTPVEFVLIDAPGGAGAGISLEGGGSAVRVGFGNNDIFITSEDNMTVTVADNMVTNADNFDVFVSVDVDLNASNNILLDATQDVIVTADGFVSMTGLTSMVLATATGDLSLSSGVGMLLTAPEEIVINAGVGAGKGVQIIGGASFVEVDFGDTDVRINATDDVVIDAGDRIKIDAGAGLLDLIGGADVNIDAGTGDVLVTSGDDVILQPLDDLILNPIGTILINGLTTFTGTRIFDDNAGSTHTVVVLKGLIRSWIVV